LTRELQIGVGNFGRGNQSVLPLVRDANLVAVLEGPRLIAAPLAGS
jgi:hypothetical protein